MYYSQVIKMGNLLLDPACNSEKILEVIKEKFEEGIENIF